MEVLRRNYLANGVNQVLTLSLSLAVCSEKIKDASVAPFLFLKKIRNVSEKILSALVK